MAPQRFDEESEAAKLPSGGARVLYTLKRLEIQALLQKAAVAQGLPPARFKEPPRCSRRRGRLRR